LTLAVALLAAWSTTGPARAELRTWAGTDDNQWFNADNWDPVAECGDAPAQREEVG
jgi:hypothetical protein